MSGIIHLRIGHNELAIEYLERAMHLEPIGPDVPNQVGFLSWARFQQGRFAEAVALGKEFVRRKPHPRGYAFLAASYGHLGLRTEAQDAAKALRSSCVSIYRELRRLYDHQLRRPQPLFGGHCTSAGQLAQRQLTTTL